MYIHVCNRLSAHKVHTANFSIDQFNFIDQILLILVLIIIIIIRKVTHLPITLTTFFIACFLTMSTVYVH
jgi:hypothetical protein